MLLRLHDLRIFFRLFLFSDVGTDVELSEAALKAATEISRLKDANTAQEAMIADLRNKNDRAEKAISHLTAELVDSQTISRLAQKQYEGLKWDSGSSACVTYPLYKFYYGLKELISDYFYFSLSLISALVASIHLLLQYLYRESIRSLQEDNDELNKTNSELVNRVVSEKEKMFDEINKMNEMVEKLRKEVDMLRALQQQEKKKPGWLKKKVLHSEGSKNDCHQADSNAQGSSRRWGSMGVVCPTEPKLTLQAHPVEATAVRYELLCPSYLSSFYE